MPCIQTKANVVISEEQEKTMKEKFGHAAGLIGKSETWLMLTFEGGCSLYFAGKDAPAAFIDVKLYGRASDEAYEKFTEAATGIVGDTLGIPPSRIYVQYEETAHWGFNGSNF